MKALIAAYKLDRAAMNIVEKLIETRGFQERRAEGYRKFYEAEGSAIVLLEGEALFAKNLDRQFDAEAIIFASRHQSEKGRPTLTVHAAGNLTGEAAYGGRPKELAWALPNQMKKAVKVLKAARDERGLPYSVSLEATHHGPTEMGKPLMFIEIGSSPEEWADQEAAEAVADAIWETAKTEGGWRTAVGFGGGHYAPKHTKVDLETELAIGHIIPKHVMEDIDPAVIEMAFRRTGGSCDLAVVDWKGTRGKDRTSLLSALDRLGKEVLKV